MCKNWGEDTRVNRFGEIPPKAVGGGISSVFRHNFRPDVDSDVISGVSVEWVRPDVRVKFGESRSNHY